jgi:hypothetical protein
MLELAAHRTPAVDVRQPILVRQLKLQDFYVEYELQVNTLPVNLLTALHGHIQDVFNEFGVQIMSPHFRAQPAQAVIVPPQHWYAAPATPPEPPQDMR